MGAPASMTASAGLCGSAFLHVGRTGAARFPGWLEHYNCFRPHAGLAWAASDDAAARREQLRRHS